MNSFNLTQALFFYFCVGVNMCTFVLNNFNACKNVCVECNLAFKYVCVECNLAC